MMGKEYEEEEMMREDLENRKNHLDRAGLLDDPDDQTHFEVSIVNKYNTALSLDACVIDGQLVFNKIKVVPQEGIQFTKTTKYDRSKGGRLGRMASES